MTIRQLVGNGCACPNVLLVFNNPLGNATGDTAIHTDHYCFLKRALGTLSFTVWTADAEIWQAVCGSHVNCDVFLSRLDFQEKFDLIVFDWVGARAPIVDIASRGRAAILHFPPSDNRIRYKPKGGSWRELGLPPMVNRPRRLREIYAVLGVDVSSAVPRVRRASLGRRIYLNPYGSSAFKCLDAQLLHTLIELLEPISKSTSVVCPSVPACTSELEIETFLSLDQIVVKASKRGILSKVPPMTITEYIAAVRKCSIVIGPDTSTQHLASLFGIPSIACYPAGTGYRFYYWGSPGSTNICVRSPGESDSANIHALASLITELVAAFLTPIPITEENRSIDLGAEFVALVVAVARKEISVDRGYQEIEAIIASIREMLPEAWWPFIIPELEQVRQEVCQRATVDGADELALARLSEIHAVKPLQVLCRRLRNANLSEKIE